MIRIAISGNTDRGRRAWRRGNAAFTLVELLVVITIIGMLMALLLPAVQSAVESGRRTKCMNNMKQIALAAVAYETTNKQYPTNWGVVSQAGVPSPSGQGTSTNGVSWLTVILPNLDFGTLYSQTSLSQPGLANTVGPSIYAVGYTNATYGINNLQALYTVVPTFLCPSDTQRGYVSNQVLGSGINSLSCAVTNYKAVAGSNWVYSFNPNTNTFNVPATMSSVGRNSAKSDGVDNGNGVICRGGATSPGGAPFVTANMDLRDGASKTFFLGEVIPQFCPWSVWFWFEGSTATCGIPLNFLRQPNISPLSLTPANWQETEGFNSRHTGGGNFAMCDGSVTFVSDAMIYSDLSGGGMAIYQGMATISGNESVSLPGG
jgi:prepilin-type N-terminal cleavage/methylation domain-containing protein/prepilin-type processing-associated H-X9-DG protein